MLITFLLPWCGKGLKHIRFRVGLAMASWRGGDELLCVYVQLFLSTNDQFTTMRQEFIKIG